MKFLSFCLCSFSFAFNLSAQNYVNVYTAGNNLNSFNLTEIVSVEVNTLTPPSSYIYNHVNGTSYNFPIFSIDSITYTINTNIQSSVLNNNISYDTIMDIDWNVYNTVQIGSQKWMAENLRVSKFSNGDSIPQEFNYVQYGDLKPRISYYDLDSLNAIPYGALYSFPVVVDKRNVCPTGWRVPFQSDYEQLYDFVGVDEAIKLKSTNNQYWYPGLNASNSSGFSIVGSGYSLNQSQFSGQLGRGSLWSNSSYVTLLNPGVINEVEENWYDMQVSSFAKDGLGSIRCIEGTSPYTHEIYDSEPVYKSSYNYGSVADIEGNGYRTVQIGDLTWMAENLRTRIFNNGDTIQLITNEIDWVNSTPIPVVSNAKFEDSISYSRGFLYNNEVIKDVREICPQGYRVPTQNDWDYLTLYLGGGSNAGQKIKSEATNTLTSLVTNETGFSAVEGEHRLTNGNLISGAGFWADEDAYSRRFLGYAFALPQDSVLSTYNYSNGNRGASLRCVQGTVLTIPDYPTLNNNLTYGTVQDIDGNSYNTIVVNGETWMAENLRTTRYDNGDLILHRTDSTSWVDETNGAYCNIYNDPLYDAKFGKLYNWYAVDSAANICPSGWHVPTTTEFNDMLVSVGSIPFVYDSIKSSGQEYWDMDYAGDEKNYGNNSTGLSFLPSGERLGGNFVGFDSRGSYWNSTISFPNYPESFLIDHINDDSESYGNSYITTGKAVRCLMD